MTTDPKREPVAEVGDLVIDVRERVMRSGLKNRDKLYAAQPPEGEGRAEIGAGPWTVTGPDHPVFRGESPLKAAMEAQRYRRHHDPVEAKKFLAAIEQIRKEGEEEDKRLIALHGSLHCPACGGSGHVGDVSSLTAPSAGHGEGWVSVPKEATEEMCRAAVIYANGNAVYKNVKTEVLKIEESIYGEAYAAMLSAAPAPPTGEGWRPIAEAPKDGTPVDLWMVDERGGGSRVVDAYYVTNREYRHVHFDNGFAEYATVNRDGWWAPNYGYDGVADWCDTPRWFNNHAMQQRWISKLPTHWMPIPAAPTPKDNRHE